MANILSYTSVAIRLHVNNLRERSDWLNNAGSKTWGGEGEIWIIYDYHILGHPSVCSLVEQVTGAEGDVDYM